MGKGFRLSLALFLSAPAQAQLPPLYLPAREYAHAFVRAAAGRLVSALLGLVPGEFWRAFPFNPQAQSSDGGSGTGDGNGGPGAGGSSTDGGTSASTDGNGNGDSADDDAATAAAVSAAVAAVTAVQDDPTAITVSVSPVDQESPLDVIQDEATTDPRGGAGQNRSRRAVPQAPLQPARLAPALEEDRPAPAASI